MRRPALASACLLWMAVIALTGCAFQNSMQRAPGAPELQPSAGAVVVSAAPTGAVALGTVTVQGNNFQSGAGCEAEALFEAKKIGATHVVIRPANSSLGRGAKCTGDAYYVPGTEQQSAPLGLAAKTSIARLVLSLLAIVAVAAPLGYFIGNR